MATPAECPKCGARMRVETSRRNGSVQLQYLACRECHARKSRAVPTSQVWQRRTK